MNENTVAKLNELYHLYEKSKLADNSYANEYSVLSDIVSRIGIEKGYVIDVAASDGLTQSCTLGFFGRKDWSGLAVEMDPNKFYKLSFLYSDFPNAKLARTRVTPYNIQSLLEGYETPKNITLLNLDIDSYDLFVIEAMLKSDYKPMIISMEINEKIPPGIFFTVNYDDEHYWQQDHFFGCSIEAAAMTVRPYGYILYKLE